MKRFTNKKKVKRFLIKYFKIQNKVAGLIIKVKILFNNFVFNLISDFHLL